MYNIFIKYYFCLLTISIFITGAISENTEDVGGNNQLQLVQVLFRHGDRNPVDPYPTDPWKNESYWPEGYGQLTKNGKMQQYRLGKYLRARYNNYLSSNYSPYEIHVESSTVDRAIASAEANLAGLYPPLNERSIWNPSILWQPIPVHKEPLNIDNKLKMNAPCPRYEELYKDFMKNSPVMNKINSEHQDLYRYLSNHSGRSIKSPEGVDFLFDALHIELLYNYTLPEWASNILANSTTAKEMHYLTSFSFKMMSYTEEMKMLKGGPLLKEMIQNMVNRTTKKMDARRKLLMYSAHDTTVATLLNTLDVFELLPPPYASMIIIELYGNPTSNNTEDYYVKLLFRNETERDPYILHIPGCDSQSPCTLKKFIDLTISKVPKDWHTECKNRKDLFSYLGVWGGALIVVLTCLAIFFLISMAFVKYQWYKSSTQQRNKYPYAHLQFDDEEEA